MIRDASKQNSFVVLTMAKIKSLFEDPHASYVAKKNYVKRNDFLALKVVHLKIRETNPGRRSTSTMTLVK